jgi:broad specificity phosphatase PhoE
MVAFCEPGVEMRQLRAIAILLTALTAQAAAGDSQLVLIVRHAEKAPEPGGDVPLTDAGRARAEALAEALAHARVDAIVTTQFRRTRETAGPLARRLQLTTRVVEAGGDTRAHARAVADAVRGAGRTVLVVGHSNTVPAIIAALGGPRLEELCESDYDNLFVLAMPAGGAPGLTQSRYGAPDPPDTPDCARSMRQ